MNQYGRAALEHWTKWLPNRIAEMADPQAYFTDLGNKISAKVEEETTRQAGQDPQGEAYLAKLGRLRMARFNAEGIVMRQMALLPPDEPDPKPTPDQDIAEWSPVTTPSYSHPELPPTIG